MKAITLFCSSPGQNRVQISTVMLEEFPCEYGYQAYLFEELQSYDEKILKDNYRKWFEKELSKTVEDIQEKQTRLMDNMRHKIDVVTITWSILLGD